MRPVDIMAFFGVGLNSQWGGVMFISEIAAPEIYHLRDDQIPVWVHQEAWNIARINLTRPAIYVAKKPVYGKNPIVKPRLIELSDERAIRIWADSVGTIPSTLKADARDAGIQDLGKLAREVLNHGVHRQMMPYSNFCDADNPILFAEMAVYEAKHSKGFWKLPSYIKSQIG